MVLKIFIFILMEVISLRAFAAPDEEFSRRDLFQRAYDSMGFVLYMAVMDQNFLGNLSPQEAAMMKPLLMNANYINTQNLFYKYGIEKVVHKGSNAFAYIAAGNRPTYLPNADASLSPLYFSDDRKMFDLKDGKPERDGFTIRSPGTPIYLNNYRINNPSRVFTFGDASSLMLHEMGRMLGKDENEAAVDSLAAKLKLFVDSQVSSTQVNGATVHVLNFPQSGFLSWVKQTLGLNDVTNFVWLFEQEGLYILVENKYGIQDLTAKILDQFRSAPLVTFVDDFRYSWRHFNFFKTDWIRILSSDSGKIEISLNLHQLQLVLPFLKRTSPDPHTQNVYGKFAVGSYGGGVRSYTFQIDHSKIKAQLVATREDVLRIEDPTYKIELIKKVWDQNDLVLVYKIDGKEEFYFPEASGHKMRIRPELIFEFNGQIIEVPGATVNKENKEYEFRLTNAKSANAGNLKVMGLEFGAAKLNLAQEGSNLRVSTWLPSREEFSLSGENVRTEAILKSVQIWNGRKWVGMNTQFSQEISTGTRIRLVFHSAEKLRSLELTQVFESTQSYSIRDTTRTGLSFDVADINRIQEGRKAIVRLEERDMDQTLKNNTLIVEFDVDKTVDTVHRFEGPVDIPAEILTHLQNKNPISQIVTEVSSLRFLESLRMTTQSLKVQRFNFKNPMVFMKKDTGPARSDLQRVPSKASMRSCEKLLQKDQ